MKPAFWGVAAAALLVIAAGGWFILARRDFPSAYGERTRQRACGGPTIGRARTRWSARGAFEPSRTIHESPECCSRFIGARCTSGGGSTPERTTARPPECCAGNRAAAFKSAGTPRSPRLWSLSRSGPSFDCAKASNDAERLVCSDRELAALDVKMADLYQLGLNSVADSNEFTGEQKVWLSRRDACTDKQCLVVSYDDRIKDLQRWIRR